MSLYLIVLIASVSVPFLFSFDSKLRFWKQWKYLFPSIGIVSSFYLVSDVILTQNGIWGFNPRYHGNIKILELPLEEWLFFVAVPYASVFLHDVFELYLPKISIPKKNTRIILIILFFSCLMVILLNIGRIYTVYIFSTILISLLITNWLNPKLLSLFFITFLLILVPFLIVNSILTGSFIDEPVFWYNPDEILGFRIFTIPVEDAGFSFSMVLMIIFVRDFLKTKY